MLLFEVKNGEVTGTLSNWPRSISLPDGSRCGNVAALPLPVRLSAGLYPGVDDKPEYDQKIESITVSGLTVMTDHVVRSWSVQAFPVESLRDTKRDQVEKQKKAMLSGSAWVYNGHEFNFTDSLATDATQFEAWIGLPGAGFPPGFSFTKKDGSELTFANVGAFRQFALAAGQRKLQIIGAAKAHIAAINALTDPVVIADYDIAAGW